MAVAFDYKKEYKAFYAPKETPLLCTLPAMLFMAMDGEGNPNTHADYQEALEVLYALSYTIKMSKKQPVQPQGYFDYVVPPLEGLWWSKGKKGGCMTPLDKDTFCWTSMIRQPEFVTESVFETAKNILTKKKPHLKLEKARLLTLTEGTCVQALHIGPYDDEPSTLQKIEIFIASKDYASDISETRKHHEIYLNDPRKTIPEKLKTILRHPVVKL